MPRSFLQSKTSLLRSRPLVVGSLIGGRSILPQIKEAASPLVDVVEVRLDTFHIIRSHPLRALPASLKIIREIKRATKKPLLLTLRSHTEQEKPVALAHRLSDQKRKLLFRALLPLCELVDVEIRLPRLASELTRFAHRIGKDVIHSLHDFKSAENYPLYSQSSRLSTRLKGDIFKIAVTPKNNDELERFFSWGKQLENPRHVLIGMGKAGFISRVIGFTFGSILTYGHLGSPAAPGQSPARELGTVIRRLYCA